MEKELVKQGEGEKQQQLLLHACAGYHPHRYRKKRSSTRIATSYNDNNSHSTTRQ
jgi:hypothetical protein